MINFLLIIFLVIKDVKNELFNIWGPSHKRWVRRNEIAKRKPNQTN